MGELPVLSYASAVGDASPAEGSWRSSSHFGAWSLSDFGRRKLAECRQGGRTAWAGAGSVAERQRFLWRWLRRQAHCTPRFGPNPGQIDRQTRPVEGLKAKMRTAAPGAPGAPGAARVVSHFGLVQCLALSPGGGGPALHRAARRAAPQGAQGTLAACAGRTRLTARMEGVPPIGANLFASAVLRSTVRPAGRAGVAGRPWRRTCGASRRWPAAGGGAARWLARALRA